MTRANFNSGRTTTQGYAQFFVQDSWQVGNRLTVNPGIRYEQEKLSGTLVSDFTLKNNWAPRVGATYLVTGDGKSKVYGSYGDLLRAHPQRSGRPCLVGRRQHQPRRLLRRRPDAADS